MSQSVIKNSVHYKDLCEKSLATVLSGNYSDVADDILTNCFKTMTNINHHTISYDKRSREFYVWDPTTLLWKQSSSQVLKGSFDNLRRLYLDNIKSITAQIERSGDSEFTDTGLKTIELTHELIRRLKHSMFRRAVRCEIEEKISNNFLDYCDAVTDFIPLNDGTMFNIFNHERRRRTIEDSCTFSINACISESITTIKPAPDSTDENHKAAWKLFIMIS